MFVCGLAKLTDLLAASLAATHKHMVHVCMCMRACELRAKPIIGGKVAPRTGIWRDLGIVISDAPDSTIPKTLQIP